MKKIVFGIILGILISSGVVYAAEMVINPNPFPVLIDGVETPVEGYNIDGYTFLKLADFRKTGLKVEFNEEKRLIEITTLAAQAEGQTETLPPSQPKPAGVPVTSAKISSVTATSNTIVEVVFDSVVDKASAEDIKNYFIAERYGKKDALPISSASLDPTGTTVKLKTGPQAAATLYYLKLQGSEEEIIFVGTISNSETLPPSQPTQAGVPVTNAKILNVVATSNTIVEVTFDSVVDKASAEDIKNYFIAERYGKKEALPISSASLDPTGTTVKLKTGPHAVATIYYLRLQGSEDEINFVGNISN